MPTRSPEIITRASEVDEDLVPEPWDPRDADSDRSLVAERERYRLQGATDGQGAGIVPAYNLNVADTGSIPSNTQDGWTRGSAGRVLGPDGKYVSRGSDVPRKSFDGEEPGLLVEAAGRTNHVTDSSDLSAGWATFGTSNSAASNLIEGESAQSVSAPTKSDRSNQGAGTFSSGTETVYVILEEETAGQWALSVLDASASSDLCFVQHDFSDDSLFVARGSVDRKNLRVLSESGPNGGRVYQLVLSYSGQTSGNTREVRVFPDRTGSDNSTIFHHVQLEEAPNASSPIVTRGSPTTRSGDDYAIFEGGQPPWWNSNEGTIITVNTRPTFNEKNPILFGFDGTTSGFVQNRGFEYRAFDGANTTAVSVADTPFQKSKVALSFDGTEFILSANGVSSKQASQGSILSSGKLELAPSGRLPGLYHRLLYARRALPESTLNRITA
ncbi:hypothetical protein [Salinibacter phage 4_17]